MKNFVYMVADPLTRKAVLVDAAWDVASVLALCKREGLEVVGNVVTHNHFDHVGGPPPDQFRQHVTEVCGAASICRDVPAIKIYIGRADVSGVEGVPAENLVECDDGHVIDLGGKVKLRLLATPGHTMGSQCLVVNDTAVVTGDTLFVGSCGRCVAAPSCSWLGLPCRYATLQTPLLLLLLLRPH